MSDYGLVWVDITPDFDATLYAESFAEEDQAELIRESESVEDSLRALYEWGYLSKRDGRIQFLLPEDAIDEGYVDKARDYFMGKKGFAKGAKAGQSGMRKAGAQVKKGLTRAWGSRKIGGAGSVAGAPSMVGKSGPLTVAQQASRSATGNMRSRELRAGAKQALRGAKKLAPAAAAAGGAVVLGLGARALYKRMKKKKDQKESLNDQDIDYLLSFAESLGFEFESLEDLNETLDIGEYLDGVMLEAEEDGLTESYSEEDILEAAMDDLEEAGYLEKAKNFFVGRKGFAKGSKSGQSGLRIGAGKGFDQLKKGVKRAWGSRKIGGAGSVAGAPSMVGKSGPLTVAQQASRSAAKSMKSRELRAGAKQAWGGVKKLAPAAGVAVGTVGAALAARAMYRKMKKRKKNESLVMDDLVQDSIDFGFEFETYDELIEALRTGEFIDSYLEDAEANGLTENYGEADLVRAALEELEELDEAGDSMIVKANRAKAEEIAARVAKTKSGKKMLPAKYSRGRAMLGRLKGMSGKQKAALGVAGVGAAVAGGLTYKKMKNRNKNESLEFTGYRSSAGGGAFENAPIPFGTGNALHEANAVKRVWDATQ